MGQEVLFRDSSKSCILAKNRLIWSILSLSLSLPFIFTIVDGVVLKVWSERVKSLLSSIRCRCQGQDNMLEVS